MRKGARMYENLTLATPENTEVGTHVLVKVGSGDVLRPGIIERFAMRAKVPAVAIAFVWANGRVTHGRIFGSGERLATEQDGGTGRVFFSTFLAPEPHPADTVDVLTNPAVA